VRGRAGRARRPRTRRGRGRLRGAAGAGARARLRNFRQATILAVAITALILLFLDPGEAGLAQQPAPAELEERAIPDTLAVIEPVATDEVVRAADQAPARDESVRPDTLLRTATDEAWEAVHEIWIGLLVTLPKVLVALAALLLAWLLTVLLRPVVRRAFRGWERSNAASAVLSISIWILAVGVAVSVLAGDVRALVGSIGLVGLALSWALQTPIESFSGWLLNSFKGYYRIGDRVAVGEVFGDVVRIDVLTTTVWEIGSPQREGFVRAEQPTGRLITFPNNEILAGSVVNLTRDFPYLWDELSIPVANRSDLEYAGEVLRGVATEVVGDAMREPASSYAAILTRAGLPGEVATEPQVFVSLDDSWTNLTVRYLVPARERRVWQSRLAQRAMSEFNRPEHAERILPVFPRRQVQLVGPDGKAREITPPGPPQPSA
jgi:small-conductance mechanosensitive channel